MFATCFSTTPTETTSAPAMPALDRPLGRHGEHLALALSTPPGRGAGRSAPSTGPTSVTHGTSADDQATPPSARKRHRNGIKLWAPVGERAGARGNGRAS